MAHSDWGPQVLLNVSNGYWQTCALHAAVKLDLFSRLDRQALDAAELAEHVGADRQALARLLHALAAMGLLLKNDERFDCSPEAAAYLSRHSDTYLGHIILHHKQLMESWQHLDQAVISGQPVRGRASYGDAEWRENFLLGMYNLATLLAPGLVGKIDLDGRRRLLDLGGGPGTWAIHFCRANPALRASVYDLPTSRPFAERTIARFGLQDRIEFVSGNYLEEDVGGRFDVAWLSHILHGEGPEGVRTILQKTRAALEPGGLLLIHEFILDDDMAGPLYPALFSLNMLLGTPSGRAYSGQQLCTLLEDAGFEQPHRLTLDLSGKSSVIAAFG